MKHNHECGEAPGVGMGAKETGGSGESDEGGAKRPKHGVSIRQLSKPRLEPHKHGSHHSVTFMMGKSKRQDKGNLEG